MMATTSIMAMQCTGPNVDVIAGTIVYCRMMTRGHTTMMLLVVLQWWSLASGQPIKRGLADPITAQCRDLEATPRPIEEAYSYTYNWGPSPPNCTGPLFVPMLWGRGTIANESHWGQVPMNATYMFGFNEPNHKSQSNMTPSEAAALWPQVEMIARTKNVQQLSGPVAAPCSVGPVECNGDTVEWLDQFVGNCTTCRFDFLAVHFYGCREIELTTFLDSLSKYNKTIWLTEFNCGGGGARVPLHVQVAWMNTSIPLLESRKDVAHYSWMAGEYLSDTSGALYLAQPNGTTEILPLGLQYISYRS